MIRMLIVAVLVAGCALTAPITGPDTAGWEKNWNDTTCEDWLTRMTEAEQQAFARFSLNEARRTTLQSAPDASEGHVTSFRKFITATCEDESFAGPDYSIVEAATVVYVLEDAFKPEYR